ncbi:MAG: hypothetical protein PHT84_03340 [Candidatus Pacebacteria bacterium]|nr:hypothetical protein [Candidatus Paceibacterota bacterium]
MMEIKELNKKQLVLLTLFITFVVSIATGIVTVSLMQQMPESVPQTVNNVIQRTIEKVTTVQVPVPVVDEDKEKDKNNVDSSFAIGEGNVLISIYLDEQVEKIEEDDNNQNNLPEGNSLELAGEDNLPVNSPQSIGQGVLLSDAGLILVDSNIINNTAKYKVVLDKTEFGVSILTKFSNGFTILKINQKEKIEDLNLDSKDNSSNDVDN